MSTLSQNLLPRHEEQITEETVPSLRGDQIIFSAREEAIFTEMLRLERHRSQRSGNPFLLALIDIPDLPKRVRRAAFRKAARAISSCTRETDVLGWYERDRQLGLLMTEIGAGNAKDLQLISRRLTTSLSKAIEPEIYQRLNLTLRVYPERSSGGDSIESDDVRSYPTSPERPRSVLKAQGALWLKRGLDIVGSLLMLALLSPLFLAIAILVKLSSPGPIFFRQTRLGQYGKRFTFFKFRTMYTNCDPAIHEAYVAKLIAGQPEAGEGKGVYKMQNDPRVTPLGRFLRKSSLDELPQFLNVLRNEMSLVGPRPPLPYEYERYKLWHKRRVLELKPGITGLWQVEGRSRTTFDQMVRLDLRYGRFRTIWSDLKIVARTPSAVIRGRGAC
jgi:lipopolysaccharide/colanic/teichoic acid biosynthesis glycosyltransferase